MESTTPPIEPTGITEPVAVQAPAPEVPPTPSETFKEGGFVQKIEDFKILSYISFALLISASIYSIMYHRQALNNLNT